MSLPELHLEDWRSTKDTLHLYTQIVGKIRLATSPPRASRRLTPGFTWQQWKRSTFVRVRATVRSPD